LTDPEPPARRSLTQVEREKLVLEHLSLARALARRYARRGEPLEDLEQVAMVGLIKAVDRFDPSRGTALASFATPTILGEIRRHFRDRLRPIRVPRGLQDAQANVSRAIGELTGSLGHSPSVTEIASHLSISADDVLDALAAASAFRPLSLSQPRDVDSDAPIEIPIEDPGFALVEGRAGLAAALRDLPARERTIIVMRFRSGLTQSEIADRIGISQMHVSRLLRQAILALREKLGAQE
jgi:RNA polymerase sigma-B factor